jgi:hypothetical protein
MNINAPRPTVVDAALRPSVSDLRDADSTSIAKSPSQTSGTPDGRYRWPTPSSLAVCNVASAACSDASCPLS